MTGVLGCRRTSEAVVRADGRRDQAEARAAIFQDGTRFDKGTARSARGQHPLKHIFQVDPIIKRGLDRDESPHAVPDVNCMRAVDRNLGDRVIAQKDIQWTQRKQVMIGAIDHRAFVARAERDRFDRQHVIQHIAQNLAALLFGVEVAQNIGTVGGFVVELALDPLAQRFERKAGAARPAQHNRRDVRGWRWFVLVAVVLFTVGRRGHGGILRHGA